MQGDTVYKCSRGRLRRIDGAETGSDASRLTSVWTPGGQQGTWGEHQQEIETEEAYVSLSVAAYDPGDLPRGRKLELSEMYPFMLLIGTARGDVLIIGKSEIELLQVISRGIRLSAVVGKSALTP